MIVMLNTDAGILGHALPTNFADVLDGRDMFLMVNPQNDSTTGPANTGLWGVKCTARGMAIISAWLGHYSGEQWHFDMRNRRWDYFIHTFFFAKF